MTSLSNIEELIRDLTKKVEILLEQRVPTTDYQDAVAAKIIQDICDKMDKCECHVKYFGPLKEVPINNFENIKEEPLENKREKAFNLHKYSYPNFDVGNASLGSSENPKAMTWPFGNKK